MYGFNVTMETFNYDNRPVAPLVDYTFEQWWFHGHLSFPPNEGDIFELPAGQPVTTELACNKGLTSYWASSEGHTDIRQGNNPCPGDNGEFPSGAMHTLGFDDLKGCALAIAYESDVTKIQPEDFTVFSINQTCVWTQLTDFHVPARMPPCPEGGCHCAWFWIHSVSHTLCCRVWCSYHVVAHRRRAAVNKVSTGVTILCSSPLMPYTDYMTGFKCNVTGSTSNVALAKAQVPRRCGADPEHGKPDADLGNCTYGAKQPFYWFQAERNNVRPHHVTLEGTF